MERWQSKVAVVTGASAGIGAAVADALARAGLTVVGLARRPHLIDKLQEQVKGKGSIHSRCCDLTNPQDIADSFLWIEETFGGTDILINNAGLVISGQITDLGSKVLSDKDVHDMFDLNIKSVIICTRHAIASMKKRNFNGHIVNMNSIVGQYVPRAPISSVYTSSKHALSAFTKALSNELSVFDQSIKTTSISPGATVTDLLSEIARTPHLEELAKVAPALQPQDIADAVLYVLSTPPHVNIAEMTVQHVKEGLY